jgi:hypothetical protein
MKDGGRCGLFGSDFVRYLIASPLIKVSVSFVEYSVHCHIQSFAIEQWNLNTFPQI